MYTVPTVRFLMQRAREGIERCHAEAGHTAARAAAGIEGHFVDRRPHLINQWGAGGRVLFLFLGVGMSFFYFRPRRLRRLAKVAERSNFTCIVWEEVEDDIVLRTKA